VALTGEREEHHVLGGRGGGHIGEQLALLAYQRGGHGAMAIHRSLKNDHDSSVLMRYHFHIQIIIIYIFIIKLFRYANCDKYGYT
jgi:hypothetical protein